MEFIPWPFFLSECFKLRNTIFWYRYWFTHKLLPPHYYHYYLEGIIDTIYLACNLVSVLDLDTGDQGYRNRSRRCWDGAVYCKKTGHWRTFGRRLSVLCRGCPRGSFVVIRWPHEDKRRRDRAFFPLASAIVLNHLSLFPPLCCCSSIVIAHCIRAK